MPNLFSTFGRAALVALGLAVAPAAFAQLSCPSGMAPVITGVGSASAEAVCGLSCGSGQVVAVDGNGNYSCTAGTPTNVAVGSCTLAQTNPIGSVPAGTAITFTGNCTTGTPSAITTLTWTVTGTGSSKGTCASSATVGTPFTCVVNAGTGGGNVSFSASNGVGSPASKTTSYAVQSGGGGSTGDFTNCSAGSAKISNFYPKSLETSGDGLGGVGTGNFFSVKMTVPAGANTATNLNLKMLGTFGMTGAIGTWAISETACDVDTPILDMINTIFSKNKLRYMKGYISPNIDTSYNYGPAGSQGNATTLSGTRTMEIGKTYYFNIKVSSCPSGYCTIDSLKLP